MVHSFPTRRSSDLSRRRHTRLDGVTGVQTCALPIFGLLQDSDFWNDLRVSGIEFLFGYGLAVAIAIPLGLAIGLSRRLQYMLSPFVDTLNAVPRVTLLPLIVIWSGIGIWSKVVVVFLGAVIPILINTQSGVKASEARFIRVARGIGRASCRERVYHPV